MAEENHVATIFFDGDEDQSCQSRLIKCMTYGLVDGGRRLSQQPDGLIGSVPLELARRSTRAKIFFFSFFPLSSSLKKHILRVIFRKGLGKAALWDGVMSIPEVGVPRVLYSTVLKYRSTVSLCFVKCTGRIKAVSRTKYLQYLSTCTCQRYFSPKFQNSARM